MKVAFAVWEDRIAPVFDTARTLRLLEVDAGQVTVRGARGLPGTLPAAQVSALVGLGVECLVCGAVSRPLWAMMTARGIEVVPFVAGELDEVIQAWREGRLTLARFAMPGCRRAGRGRCGGRAAAGGSGEQEGVMPGRGQGGQGAGAGAGRGQGRGQGGGLGARAGGRGGRMGGPAAAGPAGVCLCPACGHQQPHARGVPCQQSVCSRCGGPLTRRTES